MADEFDDTLQPLPPGARAAGRGGPVRGAVPNSRLVARLFTAAGAPLRVSLLRCLMRPLGTLGAAAVAAGAFAGFVDHRGADARIDAAAVSQVSARQIDELARFVEQVDPQALQQFVSLASNSPLAMATPFSAAALLLLYRRLHPGAARAEGAMAGGGHAR